MNGSRQPAVLHYMALQEKAARYTGVFDLLSHHIRCSIGLTVELGLVCGIEIVADGKGSSE
jgi:hypothetical protein